MSLNRQEFTTVGRDMLGRANAGETLNISKIVIGSGAATAPAELWPLSALIQHQLNVTITQKIDQGNGILLVEGSFNSSAAAVAFQLRELGVMAHIGAEADRLYSVANVLATGPDNVDPAVESIHAFKIKVVIDRAPNVTVVIGESRDIIAENIGVEAAGTGWFKDKLGNILRFKRAVAGEGIELVENPLDPFAVTIRQRILAFDLNLYVPLTNPGGTPATRFPTIQAANDYLLDFVIPSDITATINVAAGNFTTPTRITHPQASQIRIIGAAQITTNVTAIFNVDVNTISCNIGSAAGLAIGMIVLLRNVPSPFIGCHQITGITGNSVAMLKHFAGGLNTSTADNATGINGVLKWYPSILAVTGAIALFLPLGLNSISNFTVQGAGLAAGFDGITGQNGSCRLSNLNVAYFTSNLLLGPGTIWTLSEVAVVAGSMGFNVFSGGSLTANGDIFANGQTGNGILAQTGAVLSIGSQFAPRTNAVFLIGNQTGLSADSGSVVTANRLVSSMNTFGLQAARGGFLSIGDYTSAPNFLARNGTSVRALNRGTIFGTINGGNIETSSPPNRTLAGGASGNDAGYVAILDALGASFEEEEEPEILPSRT